MLQPGQSFTFTFAQAGTFPYHCDIHPTMTATITVVAAAPAQPTPAPTTAGAADTGAAPAPGADRFADPAFRDLWARTDAAPGGRTYVWGPRRSPMASRRRIGRRRAAGGWCNTSTKGAWS